MLIVFTIEFKLFLPCFGLSALYSRIYGNWLVTQPDDLASLNCRTGTDCTAGVNYLGSI